MGARDRQVHAARRDQFDGDGRVPATDDPARRPALKALWTADKPAARLFVAAAASAGSAAWARAAAGGWACALGAPPETPPSEFSWSVALTGPAGARPAPVPVERLGGAVGAASAGALVRLAGLPETAAAAVGGVDGWRWARANLPETEPWTQTVVLKAPEAAPGAAFLASAAGAEFLGAVEGASRLAAYAARPALGADAGMAAWLAAGAATAGARAWVEPAGSPAAADPAARWCAAAGLPLVLVEETPGWGLGASWLAVAAESAFAAAELGRAPARLTAPAVSLDGFESAGLLPAERAKLDLPEAASVRSGAAASGAPSELAKVFLSAASGGAFGLEDLRVFSAGEPLPGLACRQAWGLAEGAVPAAAGARLFDTRRKCAAVCAPPRGMSLGWLLHAAARNADLAVLAPLGDAAGAQTARAALEAAGTAFFARLRPADGEPAAAVLRAALRHRGLAYVLLDAGAPSAVLRDGVRPRSWEEAAV
ncbi:MAG: hypothetical protein HYZ75_12695 [Elusimicrobia bacterium]|nr:hypothetical protein [Elusimicrobiota bacterium]